jgi:hypothetical protein
MNAENLYHYTNFAETHSEYTKGDVKDTISINSSIDNEGKRSLSQRIFLLCESCFWCASSLYRINNRIEVPPLECPNCYKNSVELLTLS